MPLIISGHVLDNNRHPVGKVKISLKGKEVAESHDDGLFSVTLAKPESRVALSFATEGYVSNTRVINGKGASNGRTVIVWPVTQRVTFDSSHELDIEFGASRIRIPANALTGSGGKTFKDRARLEFTLFDVTNPFQRAAASGDYSGRLLDGSIRRLNSFGIFDLSVRDTKGHQLELAKGASATLSIAIPRKLVDHIPKKVGFFDFDMSAGLWLQVGTFQYVPETLTCDGTITRFADANGNTQHNLDEPQDTTCVTVQILNSWNAAPMANMTVQAYGAQYTFTGITNANGFVCLLVQRNASFTVEAFGQLGGSDYQTITPATFTAPNFSSGANDCGDPVMCPVLGIVLVDLIVH